MTKAELKKLIDIASGRIIADVVIKNSKVIDVFNCDIVEGDIAFSGGYIAGIEVNLRKVNDRIIKLIVSEFGVNEEWLRFGNEEMFAESKNNEKTARIASLFNDLPPHLQEVVLGTIELLRKANDTEGKQKKS